MKLSIICLVFASIFLYTDAALSADDYLTHFGLYEAKINKMINDQINTELVGHYTYLHLSHLFNDKSRYYPQVAKYFKAKSEEEMSHAERFMEYQHQRGAKIVMNQVKMQGQLKGDKNLEECNLEKNTLQEAFTCAVALESFVTDSLTELVREASDVSEIKFKDAKAKAKHSLVAGDVNDLLRSQAVVVTYQESGQNFTTSLAGVLRKTTVPADFAVHNVKYVQLAEMITHEFLGHQMEDTKELANYLSTLTNFGGDDKQVANLGSYLFDKKLEL